MIKECLLVALGGATGSIARYLLTLLSAHLAIASEIATFTANVIGSFIIGLLIALPHFLPFPPKPYNCFKTDSA